MTVGADDDLSEARAALDDRQRSPERAIRRATALLESGVEGEALIVATLALGVAQRETNDLDLALSNARTALELARRAQRSGLIVECSAAVASTLGALGSTSEALDVIDDALSRWSDHVDSGAVADLWMRRAVLLESVGRLESALAAYDRAIALGDGTNDPAWMARALCNRGVARGFAGQLTAGLEDSVSALELSLASGQVLLAAGAANNAGFVAGRLGRVPQSLAWFDRAAELYEQVGYPGRSRGVLAADRSAVLMAAGLFSEAVTAARTAVSSLEQSDDVVDLAEARLRLSSALIAAGQHDEAVAVATECGARLRDQGRDLWALLSEQIALKARAMGIAVDRFFHGPPERVPDVEVDHAAGVCDRLHRANWTVEAGQADLDASVLALAAGNVGLARSLLDRASTTDGERPLDQRVGLAVASAVFHLAGRDETMARRCVNEGLADVDGYRSSVGAPDLQVAAGGLEARLTDLDIELARRAGKPIELLRAADRARGRALRPIATGGPNSGELLLASERVRTAAAELRRARGSGSSTAGHESELVEAERALRDTARRTPGALRHDQGDVDLDELRSLLGSAELVEFIAHGGSLSAVVVGESRLSVHELGSLDEIEKLVEHATMLLARCARPGATAGSVELTVRALDDVDAELLAPLELGADQIIVVPTRRLHRAPWAGVSSFRRRAVSNAASASQWARNRRDRADPPDEVVAIAGPDLAHAEEEVNIVAATVAPRRARAFDAATTVGQAIEAMEGAGLVHFACHALVRPDNPTLSALRLGDGDLTGYDIAQLARPPHTVVLSACNAASGVVGPGDDLVGTASMLVAQGVRSVVAPTTMIGDAGSPDVMRLVHHHLRRAEPDEALREVRTSQDWRSQPNSFALVNTLVALA